MNKIKIIFNLKQLSELSEATSRAKASNKAFSRTPLKKNNIVSNLRHQRSIPLPE